jgi:cobalamin-dependent methionine synthase I
LEVTVPRREVCRLLGLRTAPDEATTRLIETACTALERAAQPRAVAVRISRCSFEPLLAGEDILAHLSGCDECLCMAVTLGTQVDALLRTHSAMDMAQAVVTDAAASAMVEAAADAWQQIWVQQLAAEGLYLTERFSPGYGDYPIALQSDLLALLDALRQIGLSATSASILTPRKSITAVCGVADHPVRGKLAGCAHCALRTTCTKRKEGIFCGQECV